MGDLKQPTPPLRIISLEDVYRHVGMLTLELELVRKENLELRQELEQLRKPKTRDLTQEEIVRPAKV